MTANETPKGPAAGLLQEGFAHHREGRLSDAERLYRAALRHEPNNPQILHLLGVLEGQRGHLPIALDLLRRAAVRDPDNAHLQNHIGETLCHLGRHYEAIGVFRRAVQLEPTNWAVWTNAADAAKVEIRRVEGLGHAEQASQLRKLAGEWLVALGNRYSLQHLRSEAETAYRDAIALDPGSATAHNDLGVLLRSSGRLVEAEQVLQRAITLRPDFAQAHSNLGAVFGDRGEDEAAVACYRKALELEPDFKQAADNLAATQVYGLIFRPEASAETIFRAHRDWGRRFMVDLARKGRDGPPVFANLRDPDRRLRVGYISPDMRQHSVSYFFEPLLAAHDPGEVETYCYAEVRRPDETTRRLQGSARHWRSVTDMDDAAVQRAMVADGIDVLVDLAGHTADTRLTVLAPNPAPVTVTWLGYPATTGLPTVNYRITDSETDPPGMADGLHTEELVRVPDGFLCYRPPADAPAVAPTPAISRGFVTFGSFNNPKKINFPCIELWAAILAAVPTARLLLKGELFADEYTRKRVQNYLEKAGVALERVDFRTWTASTVEHLGAYADVDIGLDPFPYNGTTTTCEALWMGVPVVALSGGHHAARVGASLLTRVGLHALIAENPDDYIAKAVALAGDLHRLRSLREGMRERMRVSPLMDERGFARRFEAALREMWRRWCESGP